MNPSTHPDESGIRMLAANELKPIMNAQIREVTEVLGISAGAAQILMREHKWAKERLFQSFFDNPEKIQKKCGVYARCHRCGGDADGNRGDEKVAKTSSNRASRSSSRRRHCEICMDDDGFDPEEMICMPCGHEFCETCWYGYVHNALDKGPLCVRETCPQAGCNELITEEEVTRAAPDLLPKFESYQLRSFVETYGMTRWCPGPGCEQVAVAAGSGGVFADAGGVASCDKCFTCFCLKCGEEPHAPIACKDLSRWNEKCRNESETANWILANTKPCPKCSSRIEKNQGCNHMTCSSCRYEFCWICMGNWVEHGANTGGYYRCNKFDPANEDDQSDAAKAKRELDRYLHYYKRYHAHSQAQAFAKKSLKETEARMVTLQEQNLDTVWTDVEFLKTANEQLVECRKVLKYTYAFAYYLKDVNKRTRFEYHQEMLERFTENLSELSEKPLPDMNRTEVVNQTRVVDRFMKNILKYVDDGMED
mmetsp:Transcript_5513/g.12036  ORF Transcript_5513/g.12036 Transcript_5513/m.12036 type:complete len:480 (+) Transcript_5513:375-1814(+)